MRTVLLAVALTLAVTYLAYKGIVEPVKMFIDTRVETINSTLNNSK